MVGLQQVAERVLKRPLLHQGTALLVEPHGQNQRLEQGEQTGRLPGNVRG